MDTMTIIYISMGVLAAIVIFLYSLPVIRGKMREGKSAQGYEVRPVSKTAQEQEKVCPVCKTPLTDEDVVYVKTYKGEPEDKVFIKGCSYCYDPNKTKRG
ncbi:MAG: hypothetical protein A2Y33_02145 [Spirochaetes bacterium GWF1_51_8]|nr:MAG: hypothetical protein A2Y33_02145 [Spirochaetes bacterium GWF1_51_8]